MLVAFCLFCAAVVPRMTVVPGQAPRLPDERQPEVPTENARASSNTKIVAGVRHTVCLFGSDLYSSHILFSFSLGTMGAALAWHPRDRLWINFRFCLHDAFCLISSCCTWTSARSPMNVALSCPVRLAALHTVVSSWFVGLCCAPIGHKSRLSFTPGCYSRANTSWPSTPSRISLRQCSSV